MWKYVKEFAMEEDAVGVVEIILILVVLITLGMRAKLVKSMCIA